MNKTDKLIKSFTPKAELNTSIATEMILPNNSGDHQRSIKRNTPQNDIDLANKKYVDDAIAALSSGHVIKDEGGADLTARRNLNFTGAGVTATDNAGTNSTDITIGGGGSAHVIKDEGGAGLAARTNLNFIGSIVAATDNAGTDSTDITLTNPVTAHEIAFTHADIALNTAARHTQGTDQALDTGGANEVTAANAKDAVSKKHSQNTDTGTTGNTFTIDSDSATGKIVLDVALGAADKTLTITNTALTDDRIATFQNATGTVEYTGHNINTHTMGNNKIIHTKAAGAITEISLGAAGTFLQSNGDAADMSFVSKASDFATAAQGTLATNAIPKGTLTEQGDIIYASAASTPAALAHGNSGQVLQSGGHGANPSWTDVAVADGSITAAKLATGIGKIKILSQGTYTSAAGAAFENAADITTSGDIGTDVIVVHMTFKQASGAAVVTKVGIHNTNNGDPSAYGCYSDTTSEYIECHIRKAIGTATSVTYHVMKASAVVTEKEIAMLNLSAAEHIYLNIEQQAARTYTLSWIAYQIGGGIG